MFGWIILGMMWFVGYLVAIQPIYRAIMRAHTANMMREGKRLMPGDVLSAAIGANFAALVWPLMLPWLTTRLTFGGGSGRKLEFELEIEKFRDDHAHEQRTRQQLASGRREIEVAETRVPRSDPLGRSDSGYNDW